MSKIFKSQSVLGQFGNAIAQICEEKGIDKTRVLESVEAALAAAYKKEYGKRGQIILAKLDETNGEVSFKQLKEVVDETTRNMEELEEAPEKTKEEEKQAADLLKKASLSEEIIERGFSAGGNQEDDEENSLPRFNQERDVLLSQVKKIDKAISVGDFIEIPLEAKEEYGRVASQTAKQVIIQKIREAERDSMYEEYKGKEGEVLSGVVQRVEFDRVYIDLGKAVGVIFPADQIPGEFYRIGQRLKVYVEKVESDSKGPGISLSRKSPELLVKLFELEVPEIFAKTVEIKAVAREAGNRSKIAVVSNEEGIDPIGSCVGQKGTRVQAVIDEINGEKIDIIEWSDDVEKLIEAALAPAKIVSIKLNEANKEAKAYVSDDQLSLAIGRKGQNVRLAARLTGWKIDVESVGGESEAEAEDSATESAGADEQLAEKDEKDEKEQSTEKAVSEEKAKEDAKEVKEDNEEVAEEKPAAEEKVAKEKPKKATKATKKEKKETKK